MHNGTPGNVDPKTLARLMKLGGVGDTNALLEQQMAQAMALKKSGDYHYTSAPGAALGGIADMVNAWNGGNQERAVSAQRKSLLAERDAARNDYGNAWANSNQPQEAPLSPDAQTQNDQLSQAQGLGQQLPVPGNTQGAGPQMFAQPDEQQMAIAKALKRPMSQADNARQFGNLGILSGDPVLSDFGKALNTQAKESDVLDAENNKSGLMAALEAMKERAAAARFGAGQKDAAKKQTNDLTEGLRKELLNNNVTKQAFEVATAGRKLDGAWDKPDKDVSPADDMSGIFSYMKMLDPGSSVREREYANASNTTGVPGHVMNMYNKAVAGLLLSPQQRKEFKAASKDLVAAQMAPYRQLSEHYAAMARKNGLDPKDIIVDMDAAAAPQPAAAQSNAEHDAAVAWAKSNPSDPRAAEILRLNGAE